MLQQQQKENFSLTDIQINFEIKIKKKRMNKFQFIHQAKLNFLCFTKRTVATFSYSKFELSPLGCLCAYDFYSRKKKDFSLFKKSNDEK